MTRIKIGADFLVPCDDMSISSRDRYGLMFKQVELAAKGGLHGVWMTEHHFSNYGYSPNPLMVLGGVAREFPHLHVGTAILVMPLWNPVRLAEDLAVLDIMADGKLIAGIGRGYQPYEFLGLNQDISCNRAQTEEATELMIKCWTEDDLTYEGQFYSVPEPITVLPRPVQSPYPEIWCATTSPESIRYAAQKGFDFMVSTSFTPPEIVQQRQFIESALEEVGRPDTSFNLSKNAYVICSPNEEDVAAAIEDSRWQQRTAKYLRDGKRPQGGKNHAAPFEGEPDDKQWRSRMIAGNPDECIEQILELERAGLTYITAIFEYPALSWDLQLSSLDLFTKEVMPAISGGR